MNYLDSPEEQSFRLELRAWLEDRMSDPTRYESDDEFRFDHYSPKWHKDLYDAGWLGLSWPECYGGRGLSTIYDAILNEEVARVGAPAVPHISFLGRAIMTYGTEDQKQRVLPTLLSGQVRWCQGFSEPGSGSDLASLSTRAVRVGDRYEITGQKIWTGRAQFSDRCLVLARTNPELPKHKGISAFVVNLRQDAINIQPIRQITGSRLFATVFYDQAVVAVEDRIGEEGDGWRIAMQTVAFERGPADIGYISRYRRALERIEEFVRTGGVPGGRGTDAAIGRLHMAIETLSLRVKESLFARVNGGMPGPESSVDKLLMAEVEQLLGRAAFDLRGPKSLLGEDPETAYEYLFSRSLSIMGGTTQIQKNIIAGRILGLR